MDDKKSEYLSLYFQQVESQVQFGDNKASILIASKAILLAISGGVINFVSGCQAGAFEIECFDFSWSLLFAVGMAIFLTIGLVFALLAILPARIHKNPPEELFLLSHIANQEKKDFVHSYQNAHQDKIEDEALNAIHGKARYAHLKFQKLRIAITCTLLSLACFVFAIVLELIIR